MVGNLSWKRSKYCQVIDAGYNVEIDVWVYDGIFWTAMPDHSTELMRISF